MLDPSAGVAVRWSQGQGWQDKQRIRRRYGQVSESELAAVDAGLPFYLGLVPDPD
ncbi:hypothetical protein [Synechococcus sp. CS-1332]|uniref:hypothetical protein n=1 Tax=Synechococcus sp. CS-1332 TaxID=2847972 RepID=UPI00223C4AAC|nr:hypothetical protein [Synechococcus sp. CS-1332]MCT0206939.1 hypothetical protein [Synechococcus sp. CS-1332]